MSEMNAAHDAHFKVVHTDDKGRVCVSTRAFNAGDIIFEDKAFVHASELPGRCLACAEDHECASCDKLVGDGAGSLSCPPALAAQLDGVADEMCDLDAVNTLDRARCFIKCMLMRHKNAGALDPLFTLTAANITRCLEGVRAVRKLIPGLFPAGFGDEIAAQVLGALNTNSHELEQVEGSGLFLVACILEHACNPNCSFTTHGDKIWLTAIRPVREGDRLSIDYGNNFYMPTAERRVELEDTYEFACSCEACTTLPDLCRAFRCPSSTCCGGREGKVCPRGDGGDEDENRSPKDWVCLSCGHECTEEEIAGLLEGEEAFTEALETAAEDGIGVEDIDKLVAEAKVIHPSHFAIFWALDATAKGLSENGAAATVAAAAEAAWSRVVALADESLPEFHHEKVVYWDSLAQARVVAGDVKGARQAYEKAYKISIMVSGAATQPTLDIKALMDKVPMSTAELRARYNGNAR